MITFTKNELDVFRAICLENRSVNEIARSSSPSIKTIYRIVEHLVRTGLVDKAEERGAQFSPNLNLHSVALKKFVLAGRHPIEVIVGSRLLILVSISSGPKSINRIAKETKLKQETVRVLIWTLRNFGIVRYIGSRAEISPSDTLMIEFLRDFSKGTNLMIMGEKTKQGTMLWSEGLEFIFSAPNQVGSDDVKKTGITAMRDHGLNFISDINYYHHSYWQSELTVEDIALHNILIDRKSTRGISYSILLLKKVGYDQTYLLREARRLQIQKIVKGAIEIESGRDMSGPMLPKVSEMNDLYSLYGM